MIGKLKRHRRVVPKDVVVDIVLDEKLARQIFHDGVDSNVASQSFGKMRYDDVHSRLCFAHVETRGAVTEDWLFNKEDATFPGTTGQKMLWALINEIPAQVRKADEVCLTGW